MARHALPSQAACGLAFFFAAAFSATAGSFAVSPVRSELSAARPVAAMTVRNLGAESVVVQLEAVTWAQERGKDLYSPTREVLATPPIFTVKPGGTQTIRVGLRRPADPQRELTYRLFLQEVPPPPKAGFQGLQVALRIGVPVFVVPAVPVKPVLRWQASRAPQGQLKLSVANSGNAHVQVADFKLALPGAAKPLLTQQAAAYVLPGQSREWLLKVPQVLSAGAALRVSAQTSAGDVQAEVVVQER